MRTTQSRSGNHVMVTILPARSARIFVLVAAAVLPAVAQTDTGGSDGFIDSSRFPPEIAAVMQKLGNRLSAPDKAAVTLVGTLTDRHGSRHARMTVQAPGYMHFSEDHGARAITFSGDRFSAQAGGSEADDERVRESLLAHLPDSVLLQLAAGGGLRKIGSRFRTDDGVKPDYAGPYWTLFSFAPATRRGSVLKEGSQDVFIAIDEDTWFIAEVRVVRDLGTPNQKIIQTQFSDWTEWGGQWFPRRILRLENGDEVLSFRTEGAVVGPRQPVPTFEE